MAAPIQVTKKQQINNPFFGMKYTLELFQKAQTPEITPEMLNASYAECDTAEKKQLFFSLLFSIGDVTGRKHNIFKGLESIDNGGHSNRQGFLTILQWMFKTMQPLFKEFLNAGLFNEYNCFDSLLLNRVQTEKGKTQIKKVVSLLSDKNYRKVILQYCVSVIRGKNEATKFYLAKFLTLPRKSVRKGHKRMLPETTAVMNAKAEFLTELSQAMKWEYKVNSNYLNFKGYRNWRSQYTKKLLSYMMSTHKINSLDETQLLSFIDTLPSGSLFRFRNIVNFPDKEGKYKYPTLKAAYDKWLSFKLSKQEEQRKLEAKIREGIASESDKVKLEKVKKEAHVNKGAYSFEEVYKMITVGHFDPSFIQTFVDENVHIPYNVLILVDDSGSMSGIPFMFAKFLATLMLYKNPDPMASQLLGMFSDTGRFYGKMSEQMSRKNSLMLGTIEQTSKSLIDKQKSFLENYKELSKFMDAKFQSGSTILTSTLRQIINSSKNAPEVREAFGSYPVWLVISDGDWNNALSPEASVNEFMAMCSKELGFKPYLIGMDIFKGQPVVNINKFVGIENFMYVPANPATLEMFLSNYMDMDGGIDIYTPLQSLYRTNRYAPVREVVSRYTKTNNKNLM